MSVIAWAPSALLFPVLRREFSAPANDLPWNAEASHHDVQVNGETNCDAAWYYPDLKPAAASIKKRVAFWKGVTVS